MDGVKERPILFSAPMVRAILEGRKTQTRRAVKPVGNDDGFVILDYGNGGWPYRSDDGDSATHTVKRGGKLYLDETPHDCPYGQTGDRLWARETFKHCATEWHGADPDVHRHRIAYLADGQELAHKRPAGDWSGLPKFIDESYWDRRSIPSIHMPRWASRILLEITGVRVERLQDISEEDARAEGIVAKDNGRYHCGFDEDGEIECRSPVTAYAWLWNSINGDGSWAANPWVWVVEFKRVTA